jgi:hypothetical protein
MHDLLISPSVGGVELVEYVCTHPCLINCFSEEDPDFVPEDVELVAVLYPTRACGLRVSTGSFHDAVL